MQCSGALVHDGVAQCSVDAVTTTCMHRQLSCSDCKAATSTVVPLWPRACCDATAPGGVRFGVAGFHRTARCSQDHPMMGAGSCVHWFPKKKALQSKPDVVICVPCRLNRKLLQQQHGQIRLAADSKAAGQQKCQSWLATPAMQCSNQNTMHHLNRSSALEVQPARCSCISQKCRAALSRLSATRPSWLACGARSTCFSAAQLSAVRCCHCRSRHAW